MSMDTNAADLVVLAADLKTGRWLDQTAGPPASGFRAEAAEEDYITGAQAPSTVPSGSFLLNIRHDPRRRPPPGVRATELKQKTD